jgi:glycerophosphoryl diester phosphodiesterase
VTDLSTADGVSEPRSLPIIIGHRGASGYVPEHTLASYFIAIEQGADYIEPDLVSSRDGVLVARHENEIGATTDVGEHREFAARKTRKTIDGRELEGWFTEDFTLAELKTLRVRERIPEARPGNARLDGTLEIPTFEEILELIAALERRDRRTHPDTDPPRRIGVYPETKHPSYFANCGLALEAPLLAALKRHGLDAQRAAVFIQSFETANLRALRKLTRVPLVQLIDGSGAPYDLVATGDERTYRDLVTQRGLAEIAGYADAVGVEKQLVVPRAAGGALESPTALVRDAHAQGLAVHAWTFRAENAFLPASLRSGSDPAALGDLVSEVEAYLRAGVDGVFVDQPALGVRARARFLEAQGAS